MLKTVWYVFYTELILSWRRSQEWLYPLGFFAIVISLFPLAFTPDPAFLQKYVPGCIWIAALLASLLSVEYLFFTDSEDGHLEQLLLGPAPLSLIMGAKLGAHWLVTEFPLILLTPLLCIMFHLSLATTLALCLSLLFGTPILTLIGSLGVALSLGLRQQGVLLGLLILPLVTPVLIFGVNIVQQSQSGLSLAGPLAFLAGLSVFTVTLVPWAVAAAVRVSMDD
ncbi:Heme exporter protein B [Aquicella siphonis]|uniref:Heme exporter protein B n=1 Tax=Aquicella siphonis TaxID=254247 RepID=A0A5E4PK42_9COXI|nr:heme exporter protein CcmB [Aquicella siphonis]VVC76935.1 Heme exporter protein B [Aquicella siphonis]